MKTQTQNCCVVPEQHWVTGARHARDSSPQPSVVIGKLAHLSTSVPLTESLAISKQLETPFWPITTPRTRSKTYPIAIPTLTSLEIPRTRSPLWEMSSSANCLCTVEQETRRRRYVYLEAEYTGLLSAGQQATWFLEQVRPPLSNPLEQVHTKKQTDTYQ